MTHHFTPETENVEIYDVTKKNDLMAAINSLNRLIYYKEWRKYQTCRVESSFDYLVELKKKMLILLEFVTNFFSSTYKTEFLISGSLQVECHLKQRK